MKLKNSELKSLGESLSTIAQLPIKDQHPVGYLISKNLKKVISSINSLAKGHGEIVKKFADKDEKGEYKQTKEGAYSFENNREKAEELFRVLVDKEIEIDFHTIDESQLSECNIPGDYLYPLYDYIVTPIQVIKKPELVSINTDEVKV